MVPFLFQDLSVAEETTSRLHEELAEAWENSQIHRKFAMKAMLIETMKFLEILLILPPNHGDLDMTYVRIFVGIYIYIYIGYNVI
jgi:hypothetical protein